MTVLRDTLLYEIHAIAKELNDPCLIVLLEFARDLERLGLLEARKLSAIRLRRSLLDNAVARHEGNVKAAAADVVRRELLEETERNPND